MTAKGPFPKIIFNNITTKEIEKVISSLPQKVHTFEILSKEQFGFRPNFLLKQLHIV
jgi:hypothetical protein